MKDKETKSTSVEFQSFVEPISPGQDVGLVEIVVGYEVISRWGVAQERVPESPKFIFVLWSDDPYPRMAEEARLVPACQRCKQIHR